MRGSLVQQRRNDEEESEKAIFLVLRKIRDAIHDETFKPGERLLEEQVGKMFNVSGSPNDFGNDPNERGSPRLERLLEADGNV